MRSYVLDSFAMITYFEDEPGAEKVAQILTEIQEKGARGYMSIINWGEIYYNTMRESGKDDAKRVIEQLGKYAIELVDANKALTILAAEFKAQYPIAYADCFAAALAFQRKAVVVTGDPEFRKLSGRISIEWVV